MTKRPERADLSAGHDRDCQLDGCADSSWSPGVPSKTRSLDTSGMPRRSAVAAIQRSASCSRWPRAWPTRTHSVRSGVGRDELVDGGHDLDAGDLGIELDKDR